MPALASTTTTIGRNTESESRQKLVRRVLNPRIYRVLHRGLARSSAFPVTD